MHQTGRQEETSSAKTSFAPRCLSIDLEVGIRDSRIHSFAAVKGQTGDAFIFSEGNLQEALRRLDDFAEGASFLLGHNFISFDAGHLAAANPDLRLLKLPAVDTLLLNPLAFPRNPYHHLVKHYQDGQLKRGRVNDPELDARITLEVFQDQLDALRGLRETDPDLLTAWHWLTTLGEASSGFRNFFTTVRGVFRPEELDARDAISRYLAGKGCSTHATEILDESGQDGWPLAYVLAWLSVSGGNSVMPPWVRHQFPEAGRMVKRLRDTACSDHDCAWCRERHDARNELARWFFFDDFRPEPKGADGVPLQRTIVEASMRGENVLGILPTGTGKSVCYQVPALSRYEKTGALAVVISPLVALMADQVAGLEKKGITTCASINGLLSMPERADVLDRVRMGDIGILIISPEQLRNRSVRRALSQREIGCWVLDEAHCISKWGHDFRPDYRYVGRFIRERAGAESIPPILCLTATAKPDVVDDIAGHFRERIGAELAILDGGASRENLDFVVVPTTAAEKFAHVAQILESDLSRIGPGGAIVYCSSRARTEEIASFLCEKGWVAGHFHAGLPPETKKNIQEHFISGEIRVIAATNAFGMGIDKQDVRLVIHADIPGSLENYLQEAGRAGRDRQAARCILLFTPEDVERQFGMSARSRLRQHEIQAILKSLRSLDRKKRLDGEVVATPGEILVEEEDGRFERDSATDDTRVRTAISWLEEAELLARDENRVQIFPSSLRVATVEEARKKLTSRQIAKEYLEQLLKLVGALIESDPDEGISTDELMGVSGLSAEKVRSALFDLESCGIASNDMAITAFIHVGVERSSLKRFEDAAAIEAALIGNLREAGSEMGKGDSSVLHLRLATQQLRDEGHATALPEQVGRIVRGLSMDGRSEEGGMGSVRLRRLDGETMEFTLAREWGALEKTAERRRKAAQILLHFLVSELPQGSRGTDLLAETTIGRLLAAIGQDIVLKSEVKDPPKLLERALMWLHEQDVIKLNKGLAVFRSAMTIHLGKDRRPFLKSDFEPLRFFYEEQVIQIHVMAEYAQRGLSRMADAVRLAMDYFSLPQKEFLLRWLPDQEKQLERQTTQQSWRAVVEDLRNPVQQKIVADDRERTNVLVLAGPGSGKTRVLVHRIAYLVRVRRETPGGILALAYNRHAAVEIRRRLSLLIGDDAKGVTVLTCHALAMRLAGVSFSGRVDRLEGDPFAEVLRQAVSLLKGEGLPPDEADEQRARLLAGYRWILVDEYQDIGPDQYELISALAGRTLEEDGRLSLFAVGDDDQNIYSFDGASVEFIRRFESEYAAKAAYLTENYRSTANIIAAANRVISRATGRMKEGRPISVDRNRSRAHPGGQWQGKDVLGQGKVQILTTSGDQVDAVMKEFLRLSALSEDWDWATVAVIAREWKYLDPVRAWCEEAKIPVQMGDDEGIPVWRLRETRALVSSLRKSKTSSATKILQWLETRPSGPWNELLREAVEGYGLETGSAELPTSHFIEWLAEWGREFRRRQTGLLLLTAHRAKGLEFDHVAVLDGGWDRVGKMEDENAPRRLFYVAMTRARQTLLLSGSGEGNRFLKELPDDPCLLFREISAAPSGRPARKYLRLSLREVDMGYAGRRAKGHSVHEAISALVPGDPLVLRSVNEKWRLFDRNGNEVGRLAQSFQPPEGQRFVSATVHAILFHRREDSDPKFRESLSCDEWEFVVPELIFAGEFEAN